MICKMQDTVMLGADYYETDAEVSSLLAEGRVPTGVGENTKIKYDHHFQNKTLNLHIFCSLRF